MFICNFVISCFKSEKWMGFLYRLGSVHCVNFVNLKELLNLLFGFTSWVMCPFLITLEFNHPSMLHMCLTLLVGTQSSVSGRLNAPLLRGSPTLSWCTVETMEKSSRPLGLLSMPWRLFTCWLIRTQFKLLLMLLSTGMFN